MNPSAENPPALHPVPGFRLATAATGMKYAGRDDVMLLLADSDCAAAGVLTRSKTASAAVDWCRTILKGGAARGIIVNAGNANAFTGKAGAEAVHACAAACADTMTPATTAGKILIASTGVIGEPLDPAPIIAALPKLIETAAPDHWLAAAEAIRTTDTYPKAASRQLTLQNGETITITGMAKGAGMIAPDMATMLAFIASDAAITPAALQGITREAADKTFNCISVDGDTSTSDSVLVLASGVAGNGVITGKGADAEAFATALHAVMHDLALLIIRDGEGARKLITVTITGAENDTAARIIGLAVVNSPLVKTAIAGEDANWGRVVMAVGKAGEKADRDRLAITIGGVMVARDGMRVADYDEAPIAAHMKTDAITIDIDVGVGDGAARVWGCDLTAEYVSINADYRS